jgi:hypothetical protein
MRANVGKTNGMRAVSKGQTVAEWMADFVPIVAAPHKITEWPAVLVLDSVNFQWRDSDGKRRMLYSILGAYGYDADGKNGRILKLDANPSGGAEGWTELLGSLPGRPESIVADQDEGIRKAVRATWGPGSDAELIHNCEHHLRKNAARALGADKLPADSPIRQVFRTALTSREGWDRFETLVMEQPGLLNSRNWVAWSAPRLREQTLRRPERPPVYANGAVEAALGQVRQILEPRMYSYRNRPRTNRMLELIRLAQLRADDTTIYAAAIRAHLDAQNGALQRSYRDLYDKRAKHPDETLSSLWSVPVQRAMQEKRKRKAELRAMMLARPVP